MSTFLAAPLAVAAIQGLLALAAAAVVFGAVQRGWRLRNGSTAVAWVAVIVVLVFGLLHRSTVLDLPFYATSDFSLFALARLPVEQLLNHDYGQAGNPGPGPLYLLLLGALPEFGDIGTRLPQLLIYAMSVLTLFSLAARSLSAAWAVLPVVIFATSPVLFSATEHLSALPLFTMLTLMSTWVLIESLDDAGAPEFAMYVVAAAAMWWTHAFLTIPVLFSHVITTGMHGNHRPWRWVLAISIATLLGAPELWHLAEHYTLAGFSTPSQIDLIAWAPNQPLGLWVLAGAVMGFARAARTPAPVQTWASWMSLFALVAVVVGTNTLNVHGEHLAFALPAIAILSTGAIVGANHERTWSAASFTSALAAASLTFILTGTLLGYGRHLVNTGAAHGEFAEIGALIRQGPRPRVVVADNALIEGVNRYAMQDKPGFAALCEAWSPIHQRCTDGAETVYGSINSTSLQMPPSAGPWWYVGERRRPVPRPTDPETASPTPDVRTQLTERCGPPTASGPLQLWYCDLARTADE